MRIQLVASTGSARISGAIQAGSPKLDPARTYVVQRRGISQVSLWTGGPRVAVFTAPLQVAGLNGGAGLGGHRAYPGGVGVAPARFQRVSGGHGVGPGGH